MKRFEKTGNIKVQVSLTIAPETYAQIEEVMKSENRRKMADVLRVLVEEALNARKPAIAMSSTTETAAREESDVYPK